MIYLANADVPVAKVHVPRKTQKLQVYISAGDISYEYLWRGLTYGIVHTLYFTS